MANRGADGKIIIDTEIDKSGIKHDAKDIERELAGMGKTISKDSNRYTKDMANNFEYYGRSVRRVYRGQSEEARRMHGEMKQAYMEQRMSLYKYKDQLIASKYAFFQLGKSAKTFSGTSKQFMSQVEAQGRVHKKVMDDMIKNNEMMKNQLIQSVGTIIVRTTQATRISENFTRMKNPMYQVNKGALAIADGLNQIAMRGQPAVLALKMLGPTANMKQLQDMTMMIGQGIMRVTMVALAATVTAAKFYSTLHKGAMESNKAYATAFTSMKKSIREAFEPLFQVFAAVMVPTFNFIKRLADMIVKFNEAHPKIAKFVAAILMLIPALTLLLSPLAIGIGLIAGFQAALGAAWMIIGPFITGMAAMSGTVLLVAAAITGAVVAFRHFNKEGKPLNNLLKNLAGSFKAIGGIIKAFFTGNTADISKFNKQLHDMLPKNIADGIFNSLTYILQGIEKVRMGIVGITKVVTGSFKSVKDLDKYFQGVFGAEGTARIMKYGTAIRNSMMGAWQSFKLLGDKAVLTGGYVNNIIHAFFTNNTKEIANMNKQLHNIFPPSIADGIFNSLITVLQGIDKLRMGIVAIAKVATGSFSSIADLDKYLQGAFGGKGTALILKFGNVIKSVFASVGSIFADFKNKIGAIWKAIQTAFSGGGFEPLINEVKDLIPSLIAAIVGGLPGLIIAGGSMIEKILQGMGTSIPELIGQAAKIINSIIAQIGKHLPDLIQMGAQILTNIISGITSVLPSILGVATNIINTFISTISPLIPILIKVGVAILTALINGIVEVLPTLIGVALQVIQTLLDALIPLIPIILNAGKDILMALIEGIISILPAIIETTIQVIRTLLDSLIPLLPTIMQAGIDILLALIDGIIEILPTLLDAALQIIITLFDALIDNLPKIIDAGVKMLIALIDGIVKFLPKLITAALTLIIKLVQGLIQNMPKINEAGRKILLAIVKGILSLIWELTKLGAKLIWELIKGVSGAKRKLMDAAANVVKGAFDTALGWAKSFFGVGESMGNQLAAGFRSAGEKMGNIAASVAQKAMSAAKISLGNAAGINGSHESGLNYVPFDGYIAELHKGERVLTAEEASLYNAQERSGVFSSLKMPDMTKIKQPDVSGFANLGTPSYSAPGPSETNNDQSVNVTFTGNIIVRNDDDIRRIGNELGSQINRDRRRLDR
ncbi:hypothetical protein [Listeria booriae]|uniref:hypothetical protein n=1 Tax=Listeria booriae TaxID=1552123 RepID=UPI001628172E|nr:hypothetical protein [Listeria booriae]MBC2392202.1 hypothetical protein [Listeria booriae]